MSGVNSAAHAVMQNHKGMQDNISCLMINTRVALKYKQRKRLEVYSTPLPRHAGFPPLGHLDSFQDPLRAASSP